MKIEGEKELVIDAAQRTINVIINDTIDIRKAHIEKMEVTEEAISTLKQGDIIDLTKPYNFTITTYQEYPWVINATQPIERKVRVSNQVGEAQIGLDSRMVRVSVTAEQSLSNINILEMQLGPSRSTILPDYKQIHNFILPQKFIVSYFDILEEWTVYVSNTQELVSTGEADPWALFANLRGTGQTTGTNPGFEWRKSSDTDWTKVPSESVVINSGVFTCKLSGLEPGTDYVYRAYITGEVGQEMPFKTELIPDAPPNMNIDTWTQSGKTWYPNATAANNYWATGNEGVTMAPVNKNSNTTPTDDAVQGKAARMETIRVPIVTVAAGNLYTGTYKTNISDPVTSAVMGRPYKGRPTSFSGYYKYTPVKVDVDNKNKHPDAMGKNDACHIYIRLEDWAGAEVRPANPKVIASGEIRNDQKVDAYTKFTIPVQYIDRKAIPTHIVLVGTSSQYGEDFCGGIGSVLFMDELSLGFD